MTDELPYDALMSLWRSADESLRDGDPKWMETAGAYAIDSVGQQLYSGLLRKASPMEFVTQSVSLFQLYYAPGDVVAVEVEPTGAVLRLVGFPAAGRCFAVDKPAACVGPRSLRAGRGFA